MTITTAAALTASLAACCTPAAAAQTKGEIDLSTIKSLTCTFSVSAVGGWKNGEPTGQIAALKDLRVLRG